MTFKDVDPSANFGGGPTDGLTLLYPGVGPGQLQNQYFVTADPNLPHLGLIPPPEAAPFIGLFSVEIFLGADLNGNGENDKVKVTLAALSIGDANRSFVVLPDGTVVDNFDLTFDLTGAVVDESQDPPFGPISLTGPGTMASQLVPEVPEAAPTGAGVAVGLMGLAGWWRRRRVRASR